MLQQHLLLLTYSHSENDLTGLLSHHVIKKTGKSPVFFGTKAVVFWLFVCCLIAFYYFSTF